MYSLLTIYRLMKISKVASKPFIYYTFIAVLEFVYGGENFLIFTDQI